LKLLHSLLHSPNTINDDPWEDLTDSKSKHDSSTDDAIEEEDEFGRKVVKRDLDLTDADAKGDGNENQGSNTEISWQDGDIIRYIELYFALCSKNHDFLSE
jgi:hypothetical protein